MSTRDDHNSISDSLLDLLRGELPPEDARALTARIEADPALLAERERLAALLAHAAKAHDLPLDASAADRIAARVRHRAQREEAHPAPAAPTLLGRLRWARFLAIAVGAHVLVLGLLAVFAGQRAPSRPEDERGAVLRHADGSWGPEGGPEVGSRGDPGDDAFAEPSFAVAHPMPIEELLRDLAGPSMGEPVLPIGDAATASVPGTALPAFARAGRLRSDADAKYAILARVGEKSDLAQVQQALRTLAVRQREDGSFPSASPAAVRVTSTVLLAFLGDGHTSRSGDQRDVVARGISWLRGHVTDATSPEERALALFALTEDYAFTSGELTPSEARGRAAELRALIASTAADAGAADASPWTALALDAVARAGLARTASDRGWAIAYAALPLGDTDPRTAVLEGTALLLARKADVFQAWNRRASAALRARLRAGDADAEEIALIVLALEVPYRTY